MTLRLQHADPEETAGVVHRLVDGLRWQLNHAAGYFDRLDAAIEKGDGLAEDSLPALYLKNDAATLRKLADALDERRLSLIGRAPRLRLVPYRASLDRRTDQRARMGQ